MSLLLTGGHGSPLSAVSKELAAACCGGEATTSGFCHVAVQLAARLSESFHDLYDYDFRLTCSR